MDNAVHFLHRLQAEGWCVADIHCEFDHATLAKQRIPVGATVTVKLIPGRG